MSPSTDELDATGLRDAQWFATRLRERAQERIVHSFRAHLEGGPEPADEDLAIFAKLAAEEHRLAQRRAEAAAAPAKPMPQRPAAPTAAAVPNWRTAFQARLKRVPDATALIAKAVRPPRGARAALAPWQTVIGSAAVVCLMFGGFALWYPLFAVNSAPVAAAPRPAAPVASVAMTSVSSGVAPVVLEARSMPVEPPVAAPTSEPRAPSTAIAPAAAPAHASRPAAHPTPAPRARPEPATAAVARQRAADPLASCRPLNFFARAICMNDTCAQRQFARHSSCGSVLAQRRVDEARRNPTLLN